MWSTSTAVESELRLLCRGMDHMHWLYWAGETKRETEREEAREDGILSVAGEEETMECIVERNWLDVKSGQGVEIYQIKK